MPNWKKVIVSGSDAELNSLITATFVSASSLEIDGSGSTLLSVDGSSGRLFSVTDDLSDSLFSVNTIAGLPVLEVFSDNTVKIGTFNDEAILVNGNTASITGSLEGTSSYSDNSDLLDGLNSTQFLRSDVSDTMTGNLTVTGNISSSGDLYIDGGIYDNNDTLGTADQVLFTTSTGIEWRDNIAQQAQDLVITGKNLSGGTIAKGTPLYFTGSGTSGNIVGIYPADAGNPDRMPAGGVAGESIADEVEGDVYIYGFIAGVDTSQFNAGDDVFVAVGGGYTNQKPTGSALIQKLGNVEKVDASNGSGVIQGPSWYNDLPNWEEGKVKVGRDDGQPVTSSVIHLDETNGRMGVGRTNPNYKLHVDSGDIAATSTTGTVKIGVGEGTLNANAIVMESDSVSNRTRLYNNGTNTHFYIGSEGSGADVLLSSRNEILFKINNAGSVFSGTEAMRITSTGNVGIGTTSPTEKLQINSGHLKIVDNDYDEYFLYKQRTDGTQTVGFQSHTVGALSIHSAGSEAIRIDSSQNVGIGTTSPTQPLTVAGNISGSGNLDIDGNTTIDGTLTVGGNSVLTTADEGSGNGIDADTVDGLEASAFYLASNPSGYTTNTGTVTSVGITAGTGLSGGGTVTTSGTISLAVDLSELTDMTATMVGTDEFIVLDAGADRRKAANEIGLSIFNNDSGFTTNTGTVTSVGGTGTVNGLTLTGTVTTTGNLTLGGTLSINNNDWSGADLSLANGGTGASLSDPGGDRILFWDDSTGAVTWLSAGTNITISGTTISSTDTNTTYSAGNGITLTGTTFSVAAGGGLTQDAGGLSHSDTSTQASVDNSNGTVIQDVTLDTYGHVTGLTSYNLDGRYYTETEADGKFLLNTTDTLTGDLTVTGKITAQEFHTEFVSASIIYQSGSTQFGDTTDDTHDFTGTVTIEGSGSTVFDIQGSQGQLFSITDSLSGSLFSVNDISGIPVLEVFSDETVKLGTFGDEAIIVNGNTASITGSLEGTSSYSDNSDLLDGQEGTYYLNYNNFSNTPTIGNGTITISAGTDLTTGGSFTTNQTSGATITINHADTSTLSGLYGGSDNGVVIEDITVDGRGHVTAIGTRDLDGRFAASSHTHTASQITDFDTSVKTKLNTEGVVSGSSQINHDSTTGFIANEHIDHSSVSITAGTGLSGGGDLTTSRTLAVDLSELTDMTATMVGTDEFIVLDASADRRKAANEIGLSIFNNDSGFTTNTGTVTSVGGTGTINGLTLTGTVTSTGNLTLGGDLTINNDDWSGTDLSLANGGTGASLTDPGADRILFWDDSTGAVTWLSAGTNITISGTTISATDTNTTYSAGNGITLTGTTFTVAAGGGLTQDAGGLSHSDTSTLSGTYGSTSDGTKIDQITVDAYGHITAITTGSTGDILGVTAGTGLTGGGTSGTVTVDVVSANNGIVVNADNIELATASTTFTSGVKSKMDADGVISGSSQVDYNSIQNTPTIGNATITISAGTALTTGGDFTTNQTGNETITINHSPLLRSDSTDSQTLTFGGTFDAVSNVGTTTEGHVSGSTNKTFTLPSLPSDNVTGTGTSGHVAYFTGTNAIGSESNLFWDATNNRLGIVDSTPSYTLDVNGDIRVTDDLFVDDFARIDALRVGTTATDPGDGNLYVENDATILNEITAGSAAGDTHKFTGHLLYNVGTLPTTVSLNPQIFNMDGGGQDSYGIFSQNGSTGGWLSFFAGTTDSVMFYKSTGNFRIGSSTSNGGSGFSEYFRVTGDGKVGIGTTTPAQKLTVQGNISGSGNLTLEGNLTIDGEATLGNAITDTHKIDGEILTNYNTRVSTITTSKQFAFDGGGNDAYGIFTKNGNSNGWLTFFAGTTGAAMLYPSTGQLAWYTSTDAGGTGVSQKMILDGNGDLGIGVTTADARLHIKQSSTDAGGGIRLEDATSTNDWNISMDSGDDLTFYYNTSERGYLSDTTNVSNIDFTGQHRSLVSETNDNIGETELSELLGLIVVSDGTYTNLSGTNKPQINESLPNIHLSDKEKDKRVFGVISDTEDIGDGGRTYSMGNWVSVYPIDENEPQRLVINSLGEGGIWVCNYSGSFENGDYITTSPILGLGMKQNDDLLHNYTVAKITQDCNFDNSDDYVEIEFSGSLYRKQFVGCTYHCG